jgi:hypothetical protein
MVAGKIPGISNLREVCRSFSQSVDQSIGSSALISGDPQNTFDPMESDIYGSLSGHVQQNKGTYG